MIREAKFLGEAPMFSVVIPVYNAERYLRECVDSVMSLTGYDYEVVLVDDGSSDESPAICDEYEKQYPDTIKVIHQKNSGPLLAREHGYATARGTYIVSVDADDKISPNLLLRVGGAIKEYDADVVVFNATNINENGNKLGLYDAIFFSQGFVDKQLFFDRWSTSAKLSVMWRKVFSKHLYDIGRFNEAASHSVTGEDLLQSINIIRNAKHIYYIDESLYYYRINTNSITHVFSKTAHTNLNHGRPYFLKALRELGFDTPETVQKTFDNYLSYVWLRVSNALKADIPKADKRQIIDEIRLYEMVQDGKKFLSAADIGAHKKLGLKLFYGGHDSLLAAYVFCLSSAKKLLRR